MPSKDKSSPHQKHAPSPRQPAPLHSPGAPGTKKEHRVTLLPAQGWSRRNLQFIRHVLLPQMFTPRTGGRQRPDLSSQVDHGYRVTWIGHASFLVQTEDINILIDPVWAAWLGPVKRVRHPGVAIDDLPAIHLVLITHAHYDHLQVGGLKRIACGQPIVVPQGVGRLVRKCGFGSIVEMHPWERVQCGPLEVTFTPAKHWGARHVHDVHRGFGGYLIRNSAGRTLFHCGDSAYFEGFAEISSHADIGAALLPIGAYRAMSGRDVHMNPEEALAAFRDLRAARMAPMHYGTYPLGGEPMDEPLRRLHAASRADKVDHAVEVMEEGHPVLFLE